MTDQKNPEVKTDVDAKADAPKAKKAKQPKAKQETTEQVIKVACNLEGEDVVAGDKVQLTKGNTDSMRQRGLIH